MLQAQKTLHTSLPVVLLARVLGWLPAWLRWAVAIFSVAMAVVVVTCRGEIKEAAKSALSHWEMRRARSLLQNELTAQEGVKLLLSALVRSPDDNHVIRSLAQVTDEAGLPHHARFFYEHLSIRNAMTADDRLRHAAVLARLSDPVGAQIILEKLRATEGETTELLRTQAGIATAGGDHRAAREALSRVLAKVPEDRAIVIEHAKAQAFSAEESQHRAGVDALLNAFEKSLQDYDAEQRTHCFWTLASMPLTDAGQRARFASLIERMPWKKLERQVMQRLLEASVDTTDRDGTKLREWLREMFAREADTNAEERLTVAKMLQRRGLHQLVLEWVSFDMGLKESALCTARLDSLQANGLWDEASAMVDHPKCPLPEALRMIIRAQVELVSTGGRSLKSGKLLREALTLADQRDNQGAYVAIAHLAEQFGQHEVALDAYGRALDPRFPVALFMVDAFIAEARRAGSSAEVVLKRLQRRVKDEAWNQELLRQVSYYRLLCGDGIEVIETEALQLRRDLPQEVYPVFLLGFARLRLGKTAELADCVDLLRSTVESEVGASGEESAVQGAVGTVVATSAAPGQRAAAEWSPGERAVLHAIFAAAGDVQAATMLNAHLTPDTLLFAEEKRLANAGQGSLPMNSK